MLGGSAGRGPSLLVPYFPPAICAGGIIGQTRSNTVIFFLFALASLRVVYLG